VIAGRLSELEKKVKPELPPFAIVDPKMLEFPVEIEPDAETSIAWSPCVTWWEDRYLAGIEPSPGARLMVVRSPSVESCRKWGRQNRSMGKWDPDRYRAACKAAAEWAAANGVDYAPPLEEDD
jgi:hypothetical protein